MGFFSGLLKGIGSVVGAVLNPLGTVAGLFGASKQTVANLAPVLPGLQTLAPTGAALKSLITAPASGTGLVLGTPRLGQPGVVTGAGVSVGAAAATLVVSGGNGKIAKRTIVQTINLDNGKIVNEVVLEGAPFLMNKAVRELARTTKKLKKAVKRIPTRLVTESLGKQLTNKVLRQTIDDVGDHHGHHHTGT